MSFLNQLKSQPNALQSHPAMTLTEFRVDFRKKTLRDREVFDVCEPNRFA